MALVGGGGAGNTAGSNPSGVSKSLSYMGNGQYAGWTGQITATGGNYSTALDFVSPDVPVKATISWVVNRANLGASEDICMRLTMNGVVIWDSNNQLGYDANHLTNMDVWIPAYSRFQMEFMTTDANDITFTGTVTGVEA